MQAEVILIESDSDDGCAAPQVSVNLISDSDDDFEELPLAERIALRRQERQAAASALKERRDSDTISTKAAPRISNDVEKRAGKVAKAPNNHSVEEAFQGSSNEHEMLQERPSNGLDAHPIQSEDQPKSSFNEIPSRVTSTRFGSGGAKDLDRGASKSVRSPGFAMRHRKPFRPLQHNNRRDKDSSRSVFDIDMAKTVSTQEKPDIFERLQGLKSKPSRVLDSPSCRAKANGVKRRKEMSDENSLDPGLFARRKALESCNKSAKEGGTYNAFENVVETRREDEDDGKSSKSALKDDDNKKKKKRGRKRDRDDIRIVMSRELGAKELEVMGKLVVRSGHEKNVKAEVESLSHPNMIEWRRIDEDEKTHVDCVAYWFSADDFVKIMEQKKADDVTRSIVLRSVQRPYILVYGIASYWRRAARRASKNKDSVISREAIDDCLAGLWVTHQVVSKKFDHPEQVAEFMVSTAYAVGRKPFANPLTHADLRRAYTHGKTSVATRSLRTDANGGLRPESASDLGASYQAMLALVPGISAERAKAVRKEYPALRALLSAFDKCSDDEEAKMLLADIQERSGRRLGPSAAKKIWVVFAGKDSAARVA